MEHWWKDKLGKRTVPVPLCTLQIPYILFWLSSQIPMVRRISMYYEMSNRTLKISGSLRRKMGKKN